jgi:germination protein M
MSRRAAAILLAALAAAVAALLLVHREDLPGLSRRVPRRFLRVTPLPPPSTPAAGTPAVTAVESVRVTLFFPDASGMLHAEERDIPRPTGGSAYLRALFSELQKGPTGQGLLPPLPPKVQLRNAFLREGEAVLDLAVDASLSFGSDEELSIVGSLVDTTLQNVADTSRVRILVNGEPAETLGGHVDLTRPLLFLKQIVAPTPEAPSGEAAATPALSATP